MDTIFLPSVGVDIVFNINSLTPYSRSSIIYDIDLDNQRITIAQPNIPFSKNTSFKELHLTTIIQKKEIKIRVGVECIHFNLIDRYKLASKIDVPAVILKYELPVKETNIRSAFRLPLTTKYNIKGKLSYNSLEYFTSRDFSVKNISLTGLGIVIPKKRRDSINPLTEIQKHESLIIGIVLINMDQEDKTAGTLPIKAQVIRINHDYSDTHSLIGLKILNLEAHNETILNRFIHDAQINDLKKLSRRNL